MWLLHSMSIKVNSITVAESGRDKSLDDLL